MSIIKQGEILLKKYDPSREGLTLGDLEDKFEPVDCDLLLTDTQAAGDANKAIDKGRS